MIQWEAQLRRRNSPKEDLWHNWHKPEKVYGTQVVADGQ